MFRVYVVFAYCINKADVIDISGHITIYTSSKLDASAFFGTQSYITELCYFEFLPNLLLDGQNQDSHQFRAINYILAPFWTFFWKGPSVGLFVDLSISSNYHKIYVLQKHLIAMVILYIFTDNIIITFWLYLVSAIMSLWGLHRCSCTWIVFPCTCN